MKLGRFSLSIFFLAMFSPFAWCDVNSIAVQGRFPVAQGQSFGDFGPYEYIHGRVSGTLDPQDPHNRAIVNLEQAVADEDGLVHYSADFALMQPVEVLAGGAKLLVEIPNRGRKYVLQMMNDSHPPQSGDASALSPEASLHPLSVADSGNGFLMRQGYTLAWVAWEGIAIGPGLMSATLPVAAPYSGEVREEFVFGSRIKADHNQLDLSYAADEAKPVRVTVRNDSGEAFRELPQASWKLVNGRRIAAANDEILFESGKLYDAWYTGKDPEVLGAGFAVVRDFVSLLRYSNKTSTAISDLYGSAATPVYHSVTGIGFSQPARFLREFYELGMNEDTEKRQVFDGLFIYTAGIGKSLANIPFGTPFRSNARFQDHEYPEFRPPFRYADIIDAKGMPEPGLLSAGKKPPFIMEVNTSSEYRNKAASILHTDSVGVRDISSPNNVRHYALAGIQHNGRPGMKIKRGNCRYPQNPNNPSPVLRALLVAMNEWVVVGTKPPVSQVGRIDNGTLVELSKDGFPVIPGIEKSLLLNTSAVYGPAGDVVAALGTDYRILVPLTDQDGNDVPGIRTPDIAVPLATHTGWNFYAPPFPTNEACHMYGAIIPFPGTLSQRENDGDPRLSVEERYDDQDHYVSMVKKAALELRENRFILDEDVLRYEQIAKQKDIYAE
ncbi:MAG: alpha/beta hydrolase domain-containing protein [Pseudomonadales bacterium]